MQYVIIIVVIMVMMVSIWQYVTFQYRQKAYRLHISFELFYTLIIIYALVIIGFGIIYFILSLHADYLVETEQVYPVSIDASLFRSIYFSGVTMLTIGYGDIVPLGAARVIAIVQALIGYSLPTAFVLKLVQLNMQKELRLRKKL